MANAVRTDHHTGFLCPRCQQPKTERPDRAGPCATCATQLRAEAAARFETWKARHAEQVRAAGVDAARCVCGFEWIPDNDDPYNTRCPSCGGKATT